jgi:hypothetical protein
MCMASDTCNGQLGWHTESRPADGMPCPASLYVLLHPAAIYRSTVLQSTSLEVCLEVLRRVFLSLRRCIEGCMQAACSRRCVMQAQNLAALALVTRQRRLSTYHGA